MIKLLFEYVPDEGCYLPVNLAAWDYCRDIREYPLALPDLIEADRDPTIGPVEVMPFVIGVDRGRPVYRTGILALGAHVRDRYRNVVQMEARTNHN
jgi:hypothetical protein